MRTIKYIGFYDLSIMGHERVATLSATNKMDYISSVINKAGFRVDIISPSWAIDTVKNKESLKAKKIIMDNKSITLFPTFKASSFFLKPFKVLYSLVYLLLWIVKNVKRNEKVLVYHAPLLSYPLLIAKYIKKFEIILEVEEIYSEVWKSKKLYSKVESKIIEKSEQYLCVSDLLAKRIDYAKSIVIYGNYNVPLNKQKHNNDEFINIVYAGSLDAVGGGAINSIKCADLLPPNYIVNILGTGSDKIKIEIRNKIKDINTKHGRIKCIYHGVLNGEEYSDFLHSCQIALNPQKGGNYMDTAFPSKVLSYLSHNLKVVSTKIESIVQSKVGEVVFFTENDTPESFVETITSIDATKNYNSTDLIRKLDRDFTDKIKKILS